MQYQSDQYNRQIKIIKIVLSILIILCFLNIGCLVAQRIVISLMINASTLSAGMYLTLPFEIILTILTIVGIKIFITIIIKLKHATMPTRIVHNTLYTTFTLITVIYTMIFVIYCALSFSLIAAIATNSIIIPTLIPTICTISLYLIICIIAYLISNYAEKNLTRPIEIINNDHEIKYFNQRRNEIRHELKKLDKEKKNNHNHDGLIIKRYFIRSILPSNETSYSCCICSLGYRFGIKICQTSCNHVFHQSCLNQWLTVKQTCPLCRQSINLSNV